MAKKKRRRRSSGLTPEEIEQRRQERLEARRQAKAAAVAAQRRRQFRERIIRYVLIAGALALAVWFFYFRQIGPTSIGGHPLETFSIAGEGEHQNGDLNYETVPPVSGPHAPGAVDCGIYATQVPDENLVHNLEHGAVAIQYDPGTDPDTIKKIEAIVDDYDSHVMSLPYSGMDSPIVVTSWARMMKLVDLDESAVREYIDTFRQKGPEEQVCPSDQNSPFNPSPSPPPATPTPEPTDEGKAGGDKDGGSKKDDGGDG